VTRLPQLLAALGAALAAWLAAPRAAGAAIAGITGPTFALTAREDVIVTGDGNTLRAWGYADGAGRMQYPGPTLIVNEGDTVTVTLANTLGVPTSIVFPGQEGVVATGGAPGLLTREAPAGSGSVSYRFVASRPGTYLYHSGTRPALQVEMGLLGALIVRPATNPGGQAYGHPSSAYDREFLILLSETDPTIHDAVAGGNPSPSTAGFFAVNWFINGRNAPDTMLDDGVGWLPTQPYGAMVMMHPGERILLRVINAGRDLHPFHTHGNNFTVIARDGRLLESAPGAGADLAFSDFTLKAVPGATYDAIFEWTGKGLGWDMYGHAPGDPMAPHEWAPDHGKPFPVQLPGAQDLAIGGNYSGSPYLGRGAPKPPGQLTANPNNGFFFMWHSHAEKELTNFDVFPGGMMTMLVVDPHPASHEP
jgi:FtsP/CotA-like multicopper oxidase with cupredoxin domain